MNGLQRLLALLLATAAYGAQDVPAASDELAALQSTLRELRELRGAHETNRRALEAQSATAQQSARRLAGEIAELEAEACALDRQIAGARAERDDLRAAEEASRTARAAFDRAISASIASAAELVRGGLDYRREQRLARLEPDAAELAPEQRLERFWTFVQEELRLARGAELYTIELSLDRTHAKHALVFRVGQLLQGFLTEDGLEAGLEEPGGWQVARAPALERAVRAAVEMLNRQRAPALLALPVSVPITVSGMR